MRVLSEGAHSPVADAFLAIARDAETYAKLRALVTDLPQLSEDHFASNIVVAAFLGQRPTGGYRVTIESDGRRIRIGSEGPPPDALVTQVLTTPFKIVSLPWAKDDPVIIEADGAWQRMMRPYRVLSGEFKVSGGIAGRSESFELTGELRIMRQGDLATVLFELQGPKAALRGAATGSVRRDGAVEIDDLSFNPLIPPPCPRVRASGLFTENEEELKLNLSPQPCNATDAFNGSGQLNSRATAPAPKRNDPNKGRLL